jgi:serine protease Do
VTIGSLSDVQGGIDTEQSAGAVAGAPRRCRAAADAAGKERRVGVARLAGAAGGRPAASAGIQPGDVILAVNGRPVTSVDQLKQMIAQAGNSIALLIQRDNAQIFVPVDLG